MARPATKKRNAPRKSALAKAALRKSLVVGSVPQAHKLTSKADLAQALANRPKVDFLDPFMRHAAMQAKGISLCAFLVTLAAFQRGLKVTFHYERASFDPRFAKSKMQGHRGELFSISNGARTHTFSRTLGELTDPTANAIAEDKHLTKMALKRAGVRTPEGIVVDKSQTVLIEKFLAQHAGIQFVVKPFNGTLAKGVDADIPSHQVITSICKHQGRVILEEFISGTEYRATIVGGRCVAVSRRLKPIITGDGRSSIAQLLEILNGTADSSPYWAGLKDQAAVSAFISRYGYTVNSIIGDGEEICLSNTSYGAQHEDVSDVIGDYFRSVAVSAARTIGLATTGIDMMVAPSGEPVILELNQRPYIGFHSFPMEGAGQSNSVAEAIVDYYFPETVNNRLYPNLAYDFAPLRDVLSSGQIRELSLPVMGPEWKVLRFKETGIAAKPMAKLYETVARSAGVFSMSAPLDNGGVDLCFAYAPQNLKTMLGLLPAQFRKRLEILAQAAHMS